MVNHLVAFCKSCGTILGVNTYLLPSEEEQYEFVRKIANSIVPGWKNSSLDMEDLYQEGVYALWKKSPLWTGRTPWASWASQVVAHTIIDVLRQQDSFTRKERTTLKKWHTSYQALSTRLQRTPSTEEVLAEAGITKRDLYKARRKEREMSMMSHTPYPPGDSDGEEESFLEGVPSRDVPVDEYVFYHELQTQVLSLIRTHFGERDQKILEDVFLYEASTTAITVKYGLSKTRVWQIVDSFRKLAREDPRLAVFAERDENAVALTGGG